MNFGDLVRRQLVDPAQITPEAGFAFAAAAGGDQVREHDGRAGHAGAGDGQAQPGGASAAASDQAKAPVQHNQPSLPAGGLAAEARLVGDRVRRELVPALHRFGFGYAYGRWRKAMSFVMGNRELRR